MTSAMKEELKPDRVTVLPYRRFTGGQGRATRLRCLHRGGAGVAGCSCNCSHSHSIEFFDCMTRLGTYFPFAVIVVLSILPAWSVLCLASSFTVIFISLFTLFFKKLCFFRYLTPSCEYCAIRVFDRFTPVK